MNAEQPQPMKAELRAAAQAYWEQGYVIVPFGYGTGDKEEITKKPDITEWKSWQTLPQTQEEFEALRLDTADGFGLLCGVKNKDGLYLGAIDYDVKGNVTEEAKALGRKILGDMPVTQTEETPTKGSHHYYLSREPVTIDKSFKKSTALEFLGLGGLIYVAPSQGYRRINDNGLTVLEDLQNTFYETLRKHGLVKKEEEKEPAHTEQEAAEHPDLATVLEREPTLKDVYNGDWEKYDYASRSEAEYALIIALAQHGFKPAEIREAMKDSKAGKWNDPKTGEGYRERTLEKAFRFVKEEKLKPKTTGTGKQADPQESQANRLVSLCLSQEAEFFHDQHKTAYIRVRQTDANVTMPVRSRQFKSWLANLMWQTEQKVPSNEGLSSAINVLQGKAQLDGKQHVLHNRVAPAEDGFWIDMCDDKWRAIKVDAQRWKIVYDPPILFKRYSHQLRLAEPVPGGDPWRLLSYFNINKEDSDTRLTLVCACASYFIPLIPHPILVLHGIQGSGKTWLFKLIRRVFDPSSIDVLIMPRDERERVQQLDHHWLAFYDNVTSMPTWISDSLCRAATGGGFTKRELYSDDEDVIFNFKRCVGLNGINIAAQRGDLLDRSLLVGLESIPNESRRTEEKLLASFEKEKASILGGFLDILVKAIQLYPTVKTDRLFRMADFTRWGCAIAKALGKTEEDFIKAYESKVKSQIEEAAHASPVATVLLDYLEHNSNPKNWKGTPTALFKTLLEHAKSLEISTRQKTWPKAPHVLVRQLNELAPSLKSLGWEVETSKSGGTRRISIDSVSSVPSATSEEPEGDGRDAEDATSTSSSGSLKEKLEEIKVWLLTNKDKDGLVDSSALAEKCAQLGLDTQKIVKILLDGYQIFEAPHIGKWGVK